jgi:type IV pilus assembly protein PilC
MIYPASVIFFAVLILVGIMVFVIPKFTDIFNNFGTELPTPTVMLISTANWVGGLNEGQTVPGWAVILLTPIVLFFGFKIARRAKPVKAFLDRVKLYIPILGRLVKAGSIARFSRTLGTLVGAGVPILEAIAITRDTVGNAVYENALQRVHDSIREGESFAGPLRETRVVDLIVVNMIDVGEETGELDRMLTKVADNYDDEVDNLVRTMMSMLEPVLVIVLGVIVLIIVVALFMPLPTLIQGVMSQ